MSSSPIKPDFRVPPVDAVALETRAADLATRSIKKHAKERREAQMEAAQRVVQ